VTFSFIAAIVVILLPIILRQSAIKNLRSSIKHNPPLNVVSISRVASQKECFLNVYESFAGDVG
jgi:hypothetical protein